MDWIEKDFTSRNFVRRPKINPPKLYALTAITGMIMTLVWQVNIFPMWGQVVFGGAILAGGMYLHFLASREFQNNGTYVAGYKPAVALVTSGPYRYTRNPLYISMSLMVLGFAVLIDSFWAVMFLVLLNIYIHFRYVQREEAFLKEKFGDEYEAYLLNVRRWI